APINRADVVTVESSLPAALLHQGKHRVDRWRCNLDEPAHFLDGGDECIDLQGSASFEILQHRNLVTDDGTGCVQSPLHHLLRNGETERCCYRLGFGHHGLHRARRPGSEVTRSRVARVRALIGLKQTLPHSLSQMLQRIVSPIGASPPAETRASRRATIRSEVDPSGSPMVKRLNKRCSITPGATTSQAGSTTQPMARSGPIAFHCAAPGSTLSKCRPSSGPRCL